MLTLNSTTDLDRSIISLLSDVRDAEDQAGALADDALSFDVGVLLSEAKHALQRATDLLNASSAPSRYDAEPRTVVRSAALDAIYAATAEWC
jgi:hypothetical protein